jgi:ABC transporter with metal-binding/Fe-S-binding domain ATP-binding protein
VKLAALFSGGKDSTYAIHLAEQMGHDVDRLVTMVPKDPYAMLFHTLNLDLMPLHSESMGREISMVRTSGDEREDLAALKAELSGMDVEGIVTGAIASDYQWDRINGICEEIGLRCFSPLWRKEQEMLLRDMVSAGIRAIIVGTFVEGMDRSWLGRELDAGAIDELLLLRKKYSINVSGEGGEYESLAIGSPMHSRPIKVLESRIESDRSSSRMFVTKAVLS